MDLNISDRIAVSYSASPRIAEAIAAHEAYLRNELLAERLEPARPQNGGAKLSLAGEDSSLPSPGHERACQWGRRFRLPTCEFPQHRDSNFFDAMIATCEPPSLSTLTWSDWSRIA